MNIIEILTCKYCNEIFNDPVTLNCCCENICKKHIDVLLSQSSACPLCNSDNPNQNSKINNTLKALVVDVELHKVEISNMSDYKTVLKAFSQKITTIETMLNDPESFVFNKLSDLRRLVDLDREMAKFEIDKLAEDILKRLDSYEAEFKADYKSRSNLEYYSELVNKTKTELHGYESFYKSLKNTPQERENKCDEIKVAIIALEKEIRNYEKKLFGGKSIAYEPMGYDLSKNFGELIDDSSNGEVTCDLCDEEGFSSKRYKCLVCDDYDLCEVCFKMRRITYEHQLEHPMVCYYKPEQILNLKMRDVDEVSLNGLTRIFEDDVHCGVQCNVCKKIPITGLRLKCSVCKDFDLCLACFNEKGSAEDHSHLEHPVVVENRPYDTDN